MTKSINVSVLFIILFSCYAKVEGQIYSTGSESNRTKWKQIQSENFKIIYPSDIDSLAQYYLNLLDNSYLYTNWGLQSKSKPLKVVMHNQNIMSNAFVMLAPRRMEVITVPPQDDYPQDWLQQLALHEYRHVVQTNKVNQGLTRFMKIFIGELATGADIGFIPLWFMEGDAVLNETALSSSGRGRDARFSQGVRAIELQNERRYSYDESYLGSYRSYVPNYYEYGYQMTNWATYKYGTMCWEKSFRNISNRPFILAPFYFGLKRTTGLSKSGLYNQTFDTLKTLWAPQNRNRSFTKADKISCFYKSDFVSYKFPHPLNNGGIIALRTSIDDLSRLVMIKDNKEKNLYTLGYFYGSQIAYSEKYAAWEEIGYDLRWEQRNYSVIKILDLEKGTTHILKPKERQFSPSISPDSKLIAVNKTDLKNYSWLEIYEISTGKLIMTATHPDKEQISYSSWDDNKNIFLVTKGWKGKSIYLVNLDSNHWSRIFGPTMNNISSLEAKHDSIFFTYDSEGKANIFMLNIKTGKLFQVTNMQIGSDFPAVSNDSKDLFFSEYTSKGYKLRKVDLAHMEEYKHPNLFNKSCQSVDAIAEKIHYNLQDSIFTMRTYPSKHYSKLLHSANFHSWMFPFYLDLDNLDATTLSDPLSNLHWGCLLMSQNLLSNITSMMGYYYSEGYNYFVPSVSVRAFYPTFTLKAKIGGPPHIYKYRDLTSSSPKNLNNGFQANIVTSLPLDFSSSRFSAYLTPRLECIYRNSYIVDTQFYANSTVALFQEGTYFYKGLFGLDYNLALYLATLAGFRDINPKWALYFYASYYQPYMNVHYDNTSKLAYISANLPGFLRHHSFTLVTATEHGFGNRILLPRGYLREDYLKIYRKMKASLNYTCPIAYPDFSAGPLFYIKRIQANIFYDYAYYHEYNYENNSWTSHSGNLQSTGIELTFDTHFLRFIIPFEPGIQYNYLISQKKSSYAFFINVGYTFSFSRYTSEKYRPYY